MADSTGSKMRIKQIYVYPIKSILGCTLPSVRATYVGFDYDRRFTLIRASDGKHMGISTFTQMCLFHTALISSSSPTLSSTTEPDTIKVSYSPPRSNGEVSNSFDVNEDLLVPLSPDFSSLPKVTVNMHSSPTAGYDMGSKYNEWFTVRFGFEVKLVYIGDNRRKVLGNVSPNITFLQRTGAMGPSITDAQKKRSTPTPNPSNSGPGAGGSSSIGYGALASAYLWLLSLLVQMFRYLGGANLIKGTKIGQAANAYDDGVDTGIAFSDVAPFMVINTKSWENVQARLADGEKLEVSKFRPNIVVEGADEAFEEDYWSELGISGHDGAGGAGDEEQDFKTRLVLTQNCGRCNSLNVDYATGKVGEGDCGKVLKSMQRDRRVDPGVKWSPIFGRYGFLARSKDKTNKDGGVTISVGDDVRVLKKIEERTKFEWPGVSTA